MNPTVTFTLTVGIPEGGQSCACKVIVTVKYLTLAIHTGREFLG